MSKDTHETANAAESPIYPPHGQDKARAEAKERLGLRVLQQLTQALGRYLMAEDDVQSLKLAPGSVEWTTVIDRVEFRCAVYLDTRLEITHFDDPVPEDA